MSVNHYNGPMREPVKDHKPLGKPVPSRLFLANRGSRIVPKDVVGVGAEADPLPATSTYLIDLPPDKVDLVHQPINVSPDIDPCQDHQRTHSEGNLLVIPPPNDFRDEPDAQVDLLGGSPTMGRRPMSQADIMQLLKRTVSKEEAESPTVTDFDQSLNNNNNPPSPPAALPPSPHEFDETKLFPPVVAPRPKCLPSNIILKTHKSSISSPVTSPDPSTSSSCTSPNDRNLMDPQKVRMEALRKLGLLKDDEAELSLTHHPNQYSPKLQRSWEPSSFPESPASPDLSESDSPKALSSFSPVLETPVPKYLGEYRERSRSDLPIITRLPRIISKGEKSATLERMGSGPDKDQSKARVEDYLTQLRNTRPRPASLGNGKDFRGIQGDAPHTADPVTHIAKSPEFGDGIRHRHDSGSQKLPRSQGISVLISPRGTSGEDRREALRKLGLLKD